MEQGYRVGRAHMHSSTWQRVAHFVYPESNTPAKTIVREADGKSRRCTHRRRRGCRR